MTTFQPYLNKIEKEIKSFVFNAVEEPVYLYNMILYHMGWIDAEFKITDGRIGKRLRPLLLLLCCEALSDGWYSALPAAAAVELLHNFTLIHDDIEDRDEMRHGQPTLWSIWGVPQAINAGDALYALAYRALLSLPSNLVENHQVVRAAQVYTDTILHITEGQCLDIGFETQNVVSENAYLAMIAGKTAALFGLTCELSAIIANAEVEKQAYLKDFGLALGMAFQMQDDILGLWGDSSNTGKPVGSDLVKGKKTLPIIHCAQHNGDFYHLINSTVNKAELNKAMEFLKVSGSYEYTENKAKMYLDQALESLNYALAGHQQNQIRQLVSSLMHRQI